MLEPKDKDQLVEDTISSILEKIPDLDFSDGEPLRTMIEAIMAELDLQYWQVNQVYENSFIDTSIGDYLTNLVKILGIDRLPAEYSIGRVKFYRETPATLDYSIPVGTLVETLPNSDGDIIRFETTESAVLLTGQTEIFVNIKSVEPGLISNVVANKIIIINNPPLGIESVINVESIIGGEDEETDENLRERAKATLETSGLGTVNAIESKIATVSGVKSVKVLDMARGIGTIDVLVLGDVLPMPTDKITELTNEIQNIKAGGIDIRVVEPAITTINVDISLSVKSVLNNSDEESIAAANKAIDDYFTTLQIGSHFIISQLLRKVLESSDNISDAIINTPSANVNIGASSIAILGTKNVGL